LSLAGRRSGVSEGVAPRSGAGVLAIAENPSFKPKQVMYQEGDDFEVIGRAVWAGIML